MTTNLWSSWSNALRRWSVFPPSIQRSRSFPSLLLMFGAILGAWSAGSGTLAQAAYDLPRRVLPHQVVLLTSVDFEAAVPSRFLRDALARIPEQLAHEFRLHFVVRGFRIKVRHHADQAMLWEELRDPENVGVFWLSHSGPAAASQAGLSTRGMIIDEQANDIGPIFQGVHPDLKFLGVIGCRSRDAVQMTLRQAQVFERNPELEVADFDTRVNPLVGLRLALQQSERALNPELLEGFTPTRCQRVERGFGVTITRSLPEASPGNPSYLYPAVRIESQDRVLGVFPAAYRGMQQQLRIWFDADALSAASPSGVFRALQFKLVSTSGALMPTASQSSWLGQLSFRSDWTAAPMADEGAPSRSDWNLFSDSSGNPIGVGMHVFRYRGRVPVLSEATAYHPFSCRDHSGNYFQ